MPENGTRSMPRSDMICAKILSRILNALGKFHAWSCMFLLESYLNGHTRSWKMLFKILALFWEDLSQSLNKILKGLQD